LIALGEDPPPKELEKKKEGGILCRKQKPGRRAAPVLGS